MRPFLKREPDWAESPLEMIRFETTANDDRTQ